MFSLVSPRTSRLPLTAFSRNSYMNSAKTDYDSQALDMYLPLNLQLVGKRKQVRLKWCGDLQLDGG